MTRLTSRSGWAFGALAAPGFVLLALAATVGAGPAGAVSGVTVTPGAPFTDGETVTVSVGSNSVFTPNAKVNILECADPGGSAANLPTDDSTCDGNTIQGNTVLVHGDGSLSAPNYTIYRLPSTTLGEQPNVQPVCNESNPCVLYVGQDENDFTQPKMFSAPFTVSAVAGGSSPTTTPVTSSGAGAPQGSTGGAGAASSNAAAASGAGSASPGATGHSAVSASSGAPSTAPVRVSESGTLAFTGAPALPWLVADGVILVVAGLLLRRFSLRRGQ